MTSEIPQDPAAIEQAIQRKQAHLADTVNELVYRGHPKQLAATAKVKVKDRAQGALGLARTKAGSAAETAKSKANSATDAARAKANSAGDSAKAKANSASDAAKAKVSSASDAASSRAAQAKDAVGTRTQQARNAVGSAGTTDEAGATSGTTTGLGSAAHEARPETMFAAAAGATSLVLFLTYFATRRK